MSRGKNICTIGDDVLAQAWRATPASPSDSNLLPMVMALTILSLAMRRGELLVSELFLGRACLEWPCGSGTSAARERLVSGVYWNSIQ